MKQTTANRGEWSEVYVFFHLLGVPCLMPCDDDLNPLPDEGISLPVAAIQRGNSPDGPLHYTYMGDSLSLWQIHAGKRELDERVDTQDARRESESLLHLLRQDTENRNGAFVCPQASDFLRKLGNAPCKASSAQKEDIVLTLNDARAGRKTLPECGFSIKSYLGGAPTLLNASKDHTNILYCIEGISPQDADDINCLKPRYRLAELLTRGGSLHFKQLLGAQFQENLLLVDTSMPRLLGELLRVHYTEKRQDVQAATERLAELNPLKFPRTDLYAYKVKKLLEAVSLGMTPAKPWQGTENANGGFIIVTPEGDVVSYHLYDRNKFLEYVYRNTYFEHPSTKRHQYSSIFREGERMFMKLALQIRFKERKPTRAYPISRVND